MEQDGTEVTIYLKDGGPWGFRLGGGAEFGCPLQVAKVRVNSKAYFSGLEEGDVFLAVNDRDISLSTHQNAMQIIEQGGDSMELTVLRGVKSLENVYRTLVEAYQAKRESQLASHSSNISRSNIVLSREASPSRTLHVLRRSTSREPSITRSSPLLTIPHPNKPNVEYKTFSSDTSKTQAFQQQTQASQLPPAPPRTDNSRAGSMSRSVTELQIPINQQSASVLGSTASLNKPMEPLHVDVCDNQTTQVLQQVQQSPSFSYSGKRSQAPVVVPIKPLEIPKPQREVVEFKVRNINAPRETWRPASDHYTMSTNEVGDVISYPPNPYTKIIATDSERDRRHTKAPSRFYWELMENQPEHMPGYNDPLIVDDTQGDFGGNPIIHPERKLFSDSTFYETKDSMYPTIPEQMRLCKMISGILQAPDAMRSRGGKMFHKRKLKAGEWTSEAMGKRLERPYEDGISHDYYDSWGFHHWPNTMKEQLDPEELERLENNTLNLSKHDLIPPVVAFDINSALKRSMNHGKGVEIFHRNKERAEKYTVDETNRAKPVHQNRLDDQVIRYEEFVKNYKSPWNAAWEGNIERAFAPIDPCAAQSVRDEPDLRKDENPHALNYNHRNAIFGVKYKEYAPVSAPSRSSSLRRGMSQSTSALDRIEEERRPLTRLEKMIAEREKEKTTYDTYTYKWCTPSYYGRDLINASVDERMFKSQHGSAGWYRRPGEFMHPISYSGTSGSLTDINLRRPKDFIQPRHYSISDIEDEVFSPGYGYTPAQPAPLRRPKEFYESDIYSSQPSLNTQQYQSNSNLASPAHYSYRTTSPAHSLGSRPISAF